MKTLSERISARTGEAPTPSPQSNRAVVLALRVDIQGALDDGWSVLAIYETLNEEGAVLFSYQSFRLYVNRLLLGKVVPSSSERASKKGAKGATAPLDFGSKPNKGALL
jgi:hypothetical protein